MEAPTEKRKHLANLRSANDLAAAKLSSAKTDEENPGAPTHPSRRARSLHEATPLLADLSDLQIPVVNSKAKLPSDSSTSRRGGVVFLYYIIYAFCSRTLWLRRCHIQSSSLCAAHERFGQTGHLRGTAVLGLVLILVGRFKLANVVSYLHMPVVGGYLAFIGYFCIQAGVALCISRPLITFTDWKYLTSPENLVLALPGLLAGLLLTWLSRSATNDALLPMVMVGIPAIFYSMIFATGVGLDGARQAHWVGEVAPPVPVNELFHLVDFGLVRWDLVTDIMWTWVGMVFVVSFASCLDVAAISMDKGEALDTNRELATVGIGNLMSGLTFGFTGSYIFSQTIFTYRTGKHSRWVGFFIMVVFLYVVVSPVNLLEVAPLFFLGSTLIFIGYDLLYEWLVEIRPRVLLSEYGTIWGTFVAIQIVGVDFGIVLGVLVAILDNVVSTAQTTTVRRVQKRSRAVWTPSEYKVLHDHGYHVRSPKIVVLDIAGPVFFGSSLGLLDRMIDEVGLSAGTDDSFSLIRSPHTSSFLLMSDKRPSIMRSRRSSLSLICRSYQTWMRQPHERVSFNSAQCVVNVALWFALLAHPRGWIGSSGRTV